jgi:serine/threonine-protein kinase
VLAALNHPNIAAIYTVEPVDNWRALVLELVEGPTLADRLARGPLSIGEAFRVTTQIADALEAAHEKGIVHRDLKPENIKLRAAARSSCSTSVWPRLSRMTDRRPIWPSRRRSHRAAQATA